MRDANDERGVALILALLVVALLTALILELDADARREYREAAVFRDNARAAALARSAVQLARITLQEDSRRKKGAGIDFDTRKDLWAKPMTDAPLGDGTVTLVMDDERGKLNLNGLAGSSESRTAQMVRLKRLFVLLQLEPALVDALADWVDPDDVPEPYGAEHAHYRSLNPPYRAANLPLQTLSELYLVKGFTDEVIRRLSPHVTVLPGTDSSTWVNINTATAEVLQSLDHRMTQGLALEIIAGRPYRTAQEADRIAGFEPLAKELRLSDGYKVKTDRFSARMAVKVGGVTRSALAVLQRSGADGESNLTYFRVE
jgi:general secretion pathway protein K